MAPAQARAGERFGDTACCRARSPARRTGAYAIPVRADRALDHPTVSEPPEVVRHLRGGIRATEQRRDAGSQVTVPEAGGEQREAAERLTERLDARIAEAQRGDPHAPDVQRTL